MSRRRPPGLKGKEIGLYYKSLQMKSEKNKNKNIINLTVPPNIVSSLYNNLESIKYIAKQLNIHLPPTKNLNSIITPNKPDLNPPKLDKLKHQIMTSHSKTSQSTRDNDAIIEATSIEEVSLQGVEKVEDASFIDTQTINKTHLLDVDVKMTKEEKDRWAAIQGTTSELLRMSGSEVELIHRKKEKTDILDLQSISKQSHLISTSYSQPTISSLRKSGHYKYGYEDIITGTFEEKLNECLKKCIKINVKDRESYDLSVGMCEEYKYMLNREKYKRLLKFREILPTYKKSKELLNAIKANQVVVISGETGCGKSTQVPQIILDDAIVNFEGANVKVLVTQPRRIAASSLAIRVASERDEPLGNSVGYAVRLEKKDPRPLGSIFFCTTGILISEFEVDQALTNYSHVILDEVHERDVDIDLSMCMLKKVLRKRSNLKLILMSATIDTLKLSEYFDNCIIMEIEGLAYPVQDIYLEDILAFTKYKLPMEPQRQRKLKGHQHKNSKKSTQAIEMEKDIKYKADIAPWLESIKLSLESHVYLSLQDSRIEELNIELIYVLIQHICKGNPGAILVFLPGIGDITKLLKMLSNSGSFPSSKYEIYPLHSKLPSLEQHKIFQKPPEHIRKIIIATNIAETSITIDDIVYVIDCGKIKYNGLNIEENVSTLRTEWISQANLRQRRGRAGRCQPGICYHLITSYRARQLEDLLLPEMQRSNLLEPVLAIKRLRLGNVADAMKLMPSPPAEATIQAAVRHLQQCGALDDQETLTPLGWHLARLPVHPAAGKLLLLGALFGCIDRAASVAAVWGFKDPFMLVLGKEREVDAAKRRFALGEPSDHIAISEAIIQWEQNGSYQQQRNFAYDNFLSMNTLQLLSEMKKQLASNLKQMGFLSSTDVKSAWENRNANNLCLFRALVAAALYPNIGTVKWININRRNINKPLRVSVRTPEDGRVSLHPSSVMCTGINPISSTLCQNAGANWLVYWLKQRSSDLFLIDITLVYTLPLLFFGELNVSQAEEIDNCLISISSINVCCQKETTQLLYEMRSLLDSVLASKIIGNHSNTSKRDNFENEVLNGVIKLISAEDEGAEYLGDAEDVQDIDYYESGSKRRWYK